MKFVHSDGGRYSAGYSCTTGDCAVRAIAIATGATYQSVYDAINVIGANERTGKNKRSKSDARTGVYVSAVHKYMSSIGWKWTATMKIGSGCQTHLRAEELPSGRIVCRLSKHFAAVVDGVLLDNHDCSRSGTRCVYGYWSEG
jgi:hypothetical protein